MEFQGVVPLELIGVMCWQTVPPPFWTFSTLLGLFLFDDFPYIAQNNAKIQYPRIFTKSEWSLVHYTVLQVAESEIEEMFCYADTDHDGKISWAEFQTMINPPQCGSAKKTAVTGKKVTIHPHTLSVTGILKHSRVAPLETRDTHVSATWTEIGLPHPGDRLPHPGGSVSSPW